MNYENEYYQETGLMTYTSKPKLAPTNKYVDWLEEKTMKFEAQNKKLVEFIERARYSNEVYQDEADELLKEVNQ